MLMMQVAVPQATPEEHYCQSSMNRCAVQSDIAVRYSLIETVGVLYKTRCLLHRSCVSHTALVQDIATPLSRRRLAAGDERFACPHHRHMATFGNTKEIMKDCHNGHKATDAA
jgi:hypothetical protein